MKHYVEVINSTTSERQVYYDVKSLVVFYGNRTCEEFTDFPLDHKKLHHLKWHRFTVVSNANEKRHFTSEYYPSRVF